MYHPLSEAELLEFAALEDEIGHSLSAGLDWGNQIGEFFHQSYSYVDSTKLGEVLTEGLGNIFSDAEIQDLIESFQQELSRKVEIKLESKRDIA
jgi:hypothetical protein